MNSRAEGSDSLPGRRPPKLRLLLAAPGVGLLLVLLLYLSLRNQLPTHLVRHAGADGPGYSPTPLVVLVAGGAALLLFAIGAWCALDFWKHGHWYQTQKMIVAGFLAAGYAVLGLTAASLLAVRGMAADEAGVESLGYGLLAFLVVFIAAVWAHVVLLPPGQLEELPGH